MMPATDDELADFIEELDRGNVRFSRLLAICEGVFGPARTSGSHFIFKMPWAGDPRINIQRVRGNNAKPYQVQQVIKALRRLQSEGPD